MKFIKELWAIKFNRVHILIILSSIIYWYLITMVINASDVMYMMGAMFILASLRSIFELSIFEEMKVGVILSKSELQSCYYINYPRCVGKYYNIEVSVPNKKTNSLAIYKESSEQLQVGDCIDIVYGKRLLWKSTYDRLVSKNLRDGLVKWDDGTDGG